ncbi:unnamed protein product [Effrenium voratum]|uniref:RING-type domain-containing protein n=1 Tax=Effrenium voratum TaxID=2562239 RepID=A0AA36I4Q6_9DINO|nr:unnamed protein product [Effrenium voratum]CAJ1450522.1 unnamed protein product [Effrenium voratum]
MATSWNNIGAPLLPRADWQNAPGQEAASEPPSVVPQDSDNSSEDAGSGVQDAAERARMMGCQCACAIVLWLACLGAIMMILREAAQGVTKSFYCSTDGQKEDLASPAPLQCAIPLASAATLCNMTVVGGLLVVGRFAWQAGRIMQDGPVPLIQLQQHRSRLQSDLSIWQKFSAKVLIVAGLTYLVAGAPCAGVAKLALMFLATGFITLYATALFFDHDFDQVRMSPRLLRFLLVYVLVGLTFTALASGATERVIQRASSDGPGSHGEEVGGLGASIIGPEDSSHFADVCTSLGRQEVAPATCTVPFDFVSGVSLWWAASPVFAVLLPARTTDEPTGGSCRQFLQRWRKHIDFIILFVTAALLFLLRKGCASVAPIAFGNAELGAWGVSLLALLRRVSPLTCDGWRGPLSHLLHPPGRIFSPSQCPVCLQELLLREDLCRTPCGHDFHRDCLEEWVLSRRYTSPGCPICRESLLLPESSDPSRLLLADCLM